MLRLARCVLSLRMRHLAAKSSEHSLIDALPPELIEHIFEVGEFTGDELARAMGACSAFRDAAADDELWRRACERRWAEKFLNPQECCRDILAELSNCREWYAWAETDGRRRVGAIEDLLRVEAWDVKFFRRPPYRIERFPYRLDPATGEGAYLSSSFGWQPRGYKLRTTRSLTLTHDVTYVTVEGIPDVRMVRRDDWGWELRNAMWTARSVRHQQPPALPGGRVGRDSAGATVTINM